MYSVVSGIVVFLKVLRVKKRVVVIVMNKVVFYNLFENLGVSSIRKSVGKVKGIMLFNIGYCWVREFFVILLSVVFMI